MISRLADTDHAVMARCAIIDDTGMPEGGLGKIRRNMTD
jgi:hypothetical protein